MEDSRQQTALYVASRNGNAKAIRSLIACKADVHQCPMNNSTTLGAAVSNGDTLAVKALINAKANVDSVLTRRNQQDIVKVEPNEKRISRSCRVIALSLMYVRACVYA